MLTPEQFCTRVGIQHTTLQVWVDEGWLAPRQAEAGLELSEVDLARAHLIRDLRDNMGVNDEGIGIILNVIDLVDGLRSMLQLVLGTAPRPTGTRMAGSVRGREDARE